MIHYSVMRAQLPERIWEIRALYGRTEELHGAGAAVLEESRISPGDGVAPSRAQWEGPVWSLGTGLFWQP